MSQTQVKIFVPDNRLTVGLLGQRDELLRLRPGLRICQLILEMAFGTPSRQLSSIFQHQTSVLGKPGTPRA